MEYIYAALLLHKAGKEITEERIKKILTAAEVDVDEARVKALVTVLKDVNIEEAIKKATQTFSAPAPVTETKKETKEEKKEDEKKKEEEKKSEEAAATGLGALFG